MCLTAAQAVGPRGFIRQACSTGQGGGGGGGGGLESVMYSVPCYGHMYVTYVCTVLRLVSVSYRSQRNRVVLGEKRIPELAKLNHFFEV